MDFTQKEIEFINSQFEQLLNNCSKCKENTSRERIREAFVFAYDAHYPVRRISDEPFILHSIAVASICGKELSMGTTSIIAALLHDVIEDTNVKYEDIEEKFGEEIAIMVESLTKITGAIKVPNSSVQLENFKKVFFNIAKDIRVVFIKLADRLHNMRTIDVLPIHKQHRIATEAFYIFAPIAHSLGIYFIKSEFEEIAFKISQPVEHANIRSKITGTEEQWTNLITRFTLPISAQLEKAGFDFDISGRIKTTYSIYKKMQKKNISFEDVYDVFAVRIIYTPKHGLASEKEDCFEILNVIKSLYLTHPERVRDWINTPRENGYEAYHTTAMGSGGRWIEVQIRSRRMDEIAEYGLATHLKYKGNQTNDEKFDNLLDNIRKKIHKMEFDDENIVETIKNTLSSDSITAFTPKGDTISLPTGSSIVDFAYAIHEKVGAHAISAKVNHIINPLNYIVKDGDQIEVITSSKHKPDILWLQITKTQKARYYIRKFFREERELLSEKGKKKLGNMLSELKLTITPRVLEKIKNFYNLDPETDDSYAFAAIENELVNIDVLKKILRQSSSQKKTTFWFLRNIGKGTRSEKAKSKYYLAECCQPIPGESVVGIKTKDNIIMVHRYTCPVATTKIMNDKDVVVDVKWDYKEQNAFLTGIKMTGVDNMGILNDITNLLSKSLNINIRSVNFYTHDGIFEGYIELYVNNLKHINQIIELLKKIEGVDTIVRSLQQDKSIV